MLAGQERAGGRCPRQMEQLEKRPRDRRKYGMFGELPIVWQDQQGDVKKKTTNYTHTGTFQMKNTTPLPSLGSAPAFPVLWDLRPGPSLCLACLPCHQWPAPLSASPHPPMAGSQAPRVFFDASSSRDLAPLCSPQRLPSLPLGP
ncbi:hypothetical protein HJG60_009706 [Phyllostomus discolor]|uniref:Uncharacterized protein n=1 Tax=Phyllostomus discolor TaxID=89673 RepID=A0A834EQB3_9CHIR|nr:hypothetical protein HJG60_009706 [Phyllostomus discolor]